MLKLSCGKLLPSTFSRSNLRVLINFHTYQHVRLNSVTDPLYVDISTEKDKLSSQDTTGYFKSQRREQLCSQVFNYALNISRGRLTLSNLTNDAAYQYKFNDLCDKVIKSVTGLSSKQIHDLLKSFLFMGLPPETKVIRYLENEVLWRIQKGVNLSLLIKLLELQYRFQSTDQQKHVMTELITAIPAKIEQLADPNDVISLLKLHHLFSGEFLSKIEEAALHLITRPTNGTPAEGELDKKHFDFDCLCNLIVLLAATKRRPTPLIRAATFQLNLIPSETINPSPVRIINVICALNTLNYCDVNLLGKFCDILLNIDFLANTKATCITGLLEALGQMNWSHPRLFETLAEKLTDQKREFGVKELVAYVLCCAKVYYLSPFLSDIMSHYVFPIVTRDAIGDDTVWLDFVWSLAILRQLTPAHASSVLSQAFFSSLNESKKMNPVEMQLAKLKMLNIKSVLELEMGGVMAATPHLEEFELPERSKDWIQHSDSVIDALNNFVPRDKFMTIGIKSPIGARIDAEFISNSSLKPLPIEEYGTCGGDYTKTEMKPLPPNYKRIAVIVVPFKNLLLSEKGLIGVNELVMRLMRNQDYVIVNVNQTEFALKKTTVNKVQFLQGLIKDAFR